MRVRTFIQLVSGLLSIVGILFLLNQDLILGIITLGLSYVCVAITYFVDNDLKL